MAQTPPSSAHEGAAQASNGDTLIPGRVLSARCLWQRNLLQFVCAHLFPPSLSRGPLVTPLLSPVFFPAPGYCFLTVFPKEVIGHHRSALNRHPTCNIAVAIILSADQAPHEWWPV